MKKILICFLLFGCTSLEFISYDGYKEILGTGGLYNHSFYLDDILSTRCNGVFSNCNINNNPYERVDFYYNGLPQNSRCVFLGKIYSQNTYETEIALEVFRLGGNVVTESDIAFEDNFSGTGTLLGGSTAGNVYTITQGNLNKVGTNYNVFECF
ncbi:MAG: hypothetical protein IJE82_02185 [Alphaproteobacteria bacterium]|nr:hypothetical protein [Alphaproteobacteria bacterium]